MGIRYTPEAVNDGKAMTAEQRELRAFRVRVLDQVRRSRPKPRVNTGQTRPAFTVNNRTNVALDTPAVKQQGSENNFKFKALGRSNKFSICTSLEEIAELDFAARFKAEHRLSMRLSGLYSLECVLNILNHFPIHDAAFLVDVSSAGNLPMFVRLFLANTPKDSHLKFRGAIGAVLVRELHTLCKHSYDFNSAALKEHAPLCYTLHASLLMELGRALKKSPYCTQALGGEGSELTMLSWYLELFMYVCTLPAFKETVFSVQLRDRFLNHTVISALLELALAASGSNRQQFYRLLSSLASMFVTGEQHEDLTSSLELTDPARLDEVRLELKTYLSSKGTVSLPIRDQNLRMVLEANLALDFALPAYRSQDAAKWSLSLIHIYIFIYIYSIS